MSAAWRGRITWLATLVLRGGALGLVLAGALHFGYVLAAGNLRTVLPGQVYRSGQLRPETLERVIRRHGIRTIVNLRGACPALDWYRDEALVCARLDVALEDVNFSAMRLPSTTSLAQLIDVLQRSEPPLLIHCHQGADRTGLASVMVLLLRPGIPLAEARRQLGLASGHLSVTKTGYIDRFFELYEAWLAQQDLEHTPATFRDWALHHYCPDAGRADFVLLDPPGPVLHLEPFRPRLVKVRCRNTSLRSWRFSPGLTAGIHGLWRLTNEGDTVVGMGRMGLLEALVAPGETIDLELALPARQPGRYQLLIDLNEEQHAQFFQMGNPMLCVDVIVS